MVCSAEIFLHNTNKLRIGIRLKSRFFEILVIVLIIDGKGVQNLSPFPEFLVCNRRYQA